jgi:C-terminal processing protease CtpA/Prc
MTSVFRTSIILFLVVHWSLTHSQPAVFTGKQFQEDFAIFRASLEECHPGIYWYRTRSQIDSAFDAGYLRAGKCVSEHEFMLTLDRVVSFVGCMHTGVNPSKSFRDAFWKDLKMLPIEVKMLGDKTYLYRNGSDNESLIPGTEITHINGATMDSIKQLIYLHDSADGYATTWSIASKSPHLGWFLAAYVGKEDQYRVRFKDNKEVVLQSLPMATIKANREKRYGTEPSQVPLIRLSFRNELSTAILNIDRFDNWRIGDDKFEFLEVLELKMKEIVASGMKNLIIDVGDKGGGNEYFGLKIISHLTDRPYVGYKSIEFTNKKFKSMKYSNTSWLEYAYYRMKLKFRKQPDGTYTIKYPVLDPMQPSPVQFTGNVYVITSGMTASATSDFAAQLHGLRRATFVGEETGGSYVGNTSNFEFGIKLPNTKATLYVPLSRYKNNVDQTLFFGRGLVPDHIVVPKIEDVIAGVDTQLEYTLELIRRTNDEARGAR